MGETKFDLLGGGAQHRVISGQSGCGESLMDRLTAEERVAIAEWSRQQPRLPGGAIDMMAWPGWQEVMTRGFKERFGVDLVSSEGKITEQSPAQVQDKQEEELRAAFEEFVRLTGAFPEIGLHSSAGRESFRRDGDGLYELPALEFAWRAYRRATDREATKRAMMVPEMQAYVARLEQTAADQHVHWVHEKGQALLAWLRRP